MSASTATARLVARVIPRPGRQEPPEVVIERFSGWTGISLRELWAYREVFYHLVWRNLKVRYRQTFIGAAWAILQPALMILAFSLFLGLLAGVPSGGLPYPVFVCTGVLAWNLFAAGLSNAAISVLAAEHIIRKVYFPRLLIPLASGAVTLVDFLVAMSILAVLMLWYGMTPGWSALLVPLPVAVLFLCSVGLGTWLGGLNVMYRDVQQILPFLIQVCMLATPSIYMDVENSLVPPSAVVVVEGADAPVANSWESPRQGAVAAAPEWLRWLLWANPLSGTIAFFRATLCDGLLPWSRLLASAIPVALVFTAACYWFRRIEGSFADVI